DGHGKKLETIIDNGNKTVYKFDGNGNVIRSEYYATSSQLLEYSIYKYNSAGEMAELDGYRGPDNSRPSKTKFDYDLDGMLTNISGDRWQQACKYLAIDNKGNWTKKAITSRVFSDVKVDTVVRKITYY
ncbi:MAG: hypothetical protein ACXVIY_08090, partial [Mucilaginibacter sp.]